jgi:pimeloyl-ACP methyl ester carboxylesterase
MPPIRGSVLQAPIRCAILRACRTSELDIIMNIPEWTKPALVGAGAGAIALAIVGFSWGGWMTASAAAKMSDKGSMAAVATALTPYCLANAKDDPMAAGVMAELKTANSYKRRGIVEDAGWATPLGEEKPDRALAETCLDALSDSI